jgi:hypothetical protein
MCAVFKVRPNATNVRQDHLVLLRKTLLLKNRRGSGEGGESNSRFSAATAVAVAPSPKGEGWGELAVTVLRI